MYCSFCSWISFSSNLPDDDYTVDNSYTPVIVRFILILRGETSTHLSQPWPQTGPRTSAQKFMRWPGGWALKMQKICLATRLKDKELQIFDAVEFWRVWNGLSCLSDFWKDQQLYLYLYIHIDMISYFLYIILKIERSMLFSTPKKHGFLGCWGAYTSAHSEVLELGMKLMNFKRSPARMKWWPMSPGDPKNGWEGWVGHHLFNGKNGMRWKGEETKVLNRRWSHKDIDKANAKSDWFQNKLESRCSAHIPATPFQMSFF